jgi:hypothetical protein
MDHYAPLVLDQRAWSSWDRAGGWTITLQCSVIEGALDPSMLELHMHAWPDRLHFLGEDRVTSSP